MFCSSGYLLHFSRTKNISKGNFFNPNMLEKRYSIFKEKCQIDELPEDSTEIFHRNMLDRYLYREISNTCFSEFLALFYPKSRTIRDLENDH